MESSSATLVQSEEGFQPVFFEPRPLRNLVLIDELTSLMPVTDMQVRGGCWGCWRAAAGRLGWAASGQLLGWGRLLSCCGSPTAGLQPRSSWQAPNQQPTRLAHPPTHPSPRRRWPT